MAREISKIDYNSRLDDDLKIYLKKLQANSDHDTANDIIKNIKLIKAQAVESEIMPPNNLTGITNQERETLRIWIEQGANTNN